MRVNGGRGFAWEVRSMDSTTCIAAVNFTSSAAARTGSGGSISELVIAAASAVVVISSVVVGAVAVDSFESRAFLVGRSFVSGVEDNFLV